MYRGVSLSQYEPTTTFTVQIVKTNNFNIPAIPTHEITCQAKTSDHCNILFFVDFSKDPREPGFTDRSKNRQIPGSIRNCRCTGPVPVALRCILIEAFTGIPGRSFEIPLLVSTFQESEDQSRQKWGFCSVERKKRTRVEVTCVWNVDTIDRGFVSKGDGFSWSMLFD